MDASIVIQSVIVGDPICIEVEFPDEATANAACSGGIGLLVNVVASRDSLLRHRIETELNAKTGSSTCFSGVVKTAAGMGVQPDAVALLHVRAGDVVTVEFAGGPQAQTTAMGINAGDIVIGETVSVRVVDEDGVDENLPQVKAEMTDSEGQKRHTFHELRPCPDREHWYAADIETFGDDDSDPPGNGIHVHAKDRVTFSYKRTGGREIFWTVDTFEARTIDVRITGGVSPGSPFEVIVADPGRAEDPDVSIHIINHRTGQTIEKRLRKVQGAMLEFSGDVHTSRQSVKGWLAVQPTDMIDVFYLDRRYTFYQASLQVLPPLKKIGDLPWPKKYCCRAFLMPSLKPLLAELHCLEMRLHYYRSMATRISKSHRADLVERSLKRAAMTLNDNHWDLTPAWEALHEARRQEIYLLADTEAAGEVYRILPESKGFSGAEHQKGIEALLEMSKAQRRKNPATDRWRGYLVSALKILHEQLDSYYIRQNMIRDRMVMMTIILAALLTAFFWIQWNSNISVALVNNRTIKDIFTNRSPLSLELGNAADEHKALVRFVGETVVGQPMVLAVNDPEVQNANEVSVFLRCTTDTINLCPVWKDAYALTNVPDRNGWYRLILQTGQGDAKNESAGVLQFQPGAEIIATYVRQDTSTGDTVQRWTARTRMLDAKWYTEVDLGHGWIVFASCLLGAIGACLSTLTDLKSGNQMQNFLDSIMVTLVRPVIGFTAALLLFISINAKILNIEPTLTMFWLLCFVSGFSDRIVLGVVSKIEGAAKGGR